MHVSMSEILLRFTVVAAVAAVAAKDSSGCAATDKMNYQLRQEEPARLALNTSSNTN
jgi:hypothetical protein